MEQQPSKERCDGCQGTVYFGLVGHLPNCPVKQAWLDMAPDCPDCGGRERHRPECPVLVECREAKRRDEEMLTQHPELEAFERPLTRGESLRWFLSAGVVATHIKRRRRFNKRWIGSAAYEYEPYLGTELIW